MKKIKSYCLRHSCISVLLPIVFILIGSNICFADSLQMPWQQHNLEEYEAGITGLDAFSGNSCAYIKSKISPIRQHGEIIQEFDTPNSWFGQRIKLTAYLKAINVENAAGLYIITVNNIGKSNYDEVKINNENREWTQYSVILDVQHDVIAIKFGAWLSGKGEFRVDDFAIETIDKDVKIESKYIEISNRPFTNLDFEKKSENNSLQMPWNQTNMEEYDTGMISSDSYSGNQCAYIKSKNNRNINLGCIAQHIAPPKKEWLGKKIQLTGYIKSINVETAYLNFEVRYKNGDFSRDNMRDRPVKGNTNWTQHALTLDVPYDSVWIKIGACLKGKGEIRVDNFQFQVVDNSVETTGEYHKRIYGNPQNLDFEHNLTRGSEQ